MVMTINTRKPIAAIVCPAAYSYRLLTLLQSVMPEFQCVYVVVQDPSLVIRASQKGLGLLLRADIEGLVVDALEAAIDHCIFLLCLKYTLV